MTSTTSSAETLAYFDDLASQWGGNYELKPLFRQRLERLTYLLRNVDLRDLRVLDLGCGSGHISLFFAKSGSRVFGIDVSPKMIEATRQTLSIEGLTASLSLGDATSLQFPDDYFDIVSCISVIEWIENDQKVLLEIARVLRPGGIAVISAPNVRSIFRAVEKISFWWRKAITRFLPISVGYLQHQKHQYIPSDFDKRLYDCGMTKTDHTYYVTPLTRFGLLRWLGRQAAFGMMYFVMARKKES